MTAEERVREVANDNELRDYGAVRLADIRELLTLVDALRAANAEQAKVIAALTTPTVSTAPYYISIVSPRLCAEPCCKGGAK